MEEKIKPGGLVAGAQSFLEEMKLLKEIQDHSGQLVSSIVFILDFHFMS